MRLAQRISCLHYRATLTYAIDDLYLHIWGQSCAWAESTCICIVGTVDGRDYDGQLKYTICDTCRPYHSILSTLKPVSCQLRQIHCTYQSLRCLDLKIWRFFMDNDNDNDNENNNTTDYFTPCACTQSNNRQPTHTKINESNYAKFKGLSVYKLSGIHPGTELEWGWRERDK